MNLMNIFKTKEVAPPPIVEERAVDFGTVLPFHKLNGSAYPLFLSSVFRATDLISDSVAMLPIHVVRKDKESEIIDHDLYRVFDDGVIGLGKFNFIKFMVMDALTKGNAYAYIIRENGKVKSLKILPPESVTPQYSPNSPKVINYICSSINKTVYPEDMIHFVRHVDNSYQGKGNIFYANRTTNGASAAENLTSDNFEKGGIVKGILTSEKNLNAVQKEQIHSDWAKQMGTTWWQSLGNGTQDGIAVLQESLKFQPIQTSASEQQLKECREFYVVEVARFFGINPVLLGDLSHASWQTLEVAQQDFILHCLQGWIMVIEDEFTKKLLTKEEKELYKIDLDEKAIIKTDKQAQANYYSTMLKNGILSVNEVRKEMGLEPIEGGDKHIVPFTDINQNQINTDNKDEGNKEL